MRKYRIIYSLIAVLSLFFTACDPIVSNDGGQGALLTADQLSLDVHATTDGGNQVVMINTTPNTAGMWATPVGNFNIQNDTILLPFIGDNKIYFYATSAGGLATDSFSIKVTKIDHALSSTWSNLAGTGSKTWVWATDIPADFVPGVQAGMCYGNGGYLASNAPTWWLNGQSELAGWGVADDQMTFDLNGSANFTLVTGNNQTLDGGADKGLPAGTYKGSFKFDMSDSLQTVNSPGASSKTLWSVGTLKLTGATVSLGYQPNTPNADLIYTYNILYLDENVMILGAPEPGAGSWDGAWFWVFKRKGYTFPAN